MEAHAHSHTERKKWTHYLWEFFMLFLAVFCGFLTENIREHRIEKIKEGQFISSMIKELEADTIEVNDVLKDSTSFHGYDSLINIVFFTEPGKIDTRMAYYLIWHYTTRYVYATLSMNTFTQLKNSGNMRLIHKQEIIDSLYDLDNYISVINAQLNSISDQYIPQSEQLANKIFNQKYFLETNGKDLRAYLLSLPEAPLLMTNDSSMLIEYGNFLRDVKTSFKVYLRMLSRLNKKINGIQLFLKKEYHLSEKTPLEK